MTGLSHPDNPPPPQQMVHTITKRNTLKLFTDHLRSQIIRAVANEPRTIQTVAEELGLRPSNMYYHFQILERHGLIEIVSTRRLAGAVREHYYRAVARIYHIDRAILTMADLTNEERELIDRLEATLGTAQQEIQESGAAQLLDQYYIDLSTDKATLLQNRLTALIEEFTREKSQQDDTTYGLTVAFYARPE